MRGFPRIATIRSSFRSGALLLAVSLAVATLAGSPAPVAAASDGAPTQVPDAAASRLIVVWREPVVAGVAARVAGVREEMRGPNKRRSVVIAKSGQSAKVAASLRADPRVLSVRVDNLKQLTDYPATAPNDPRYSAGQRDLVKMRVPAAWLRTIGSPAQIVAVLDTGMDRSHPDLDDVRVISPYNAITGGTDVTDTDGHGTHVIGEIAAETNNGIGIAGIAPGVAIMPVKVCGDDGCWDSDVEDGIDWARLHGATVISMSFAGSMWSKQQQSVITNAYDAGITIVAAAGNSGDATVNYPASYTHVLSVAATNNSDQHASFSNHNGAVDVSAPGVDILSTYRGGYRSMSGTSMSTPHVSAVAALVRSAHPSFTPAQTEQALRTTAVDLGKPGRDDFFGSGRVNAAAAVAYTGVVVLDTARPKVSKMSPATGRTGVDRDGNIRITFSEKVLHVGKTTVRLVNDATGSVLRLRSFTYNATTHVLTIDPYNRLKSLKSYRVMVRTGITDAFGNTLASTKWTFKTGRH